MLRTENDATNLPQIRGTGEEHLRYFIENRLNYCDSKWYAGDYPEDNAVVRIYTPVDENGVPLTDLAIPANANITVTPYSNMYAGVRYKANGTLMQERLEANETYTFVAPNETFNDTETAIYGASQLSSLGDLAPLYLGYIDVGAATKLVELKIGDGTEGYKNANLYHLAVGTNRLLKKIDIQNCDSPRFVQALVLSGCPNIEEVYAKGSSITGVELPDSGYLKILQLPATITNLTLKNQPYIEDLTIEGYESIKTITIENCPAIDSLDILDKAINVERVRLTNVDWHYDDTSILYELIERDIAGIDENGVNTNTMWVDGKCHIKTLTGEQYAYVKNAYPYLTITYDTLTTVLTYMSEDGNEKLHEETIVNGGDGSGEVDSDILVGNLTYGKIDGTTGEITSDSTIVHTDYIQIDNPEKLELLFSNTDGLAFAVILYDDNYNHVVPGYSPWSGSSYGGGFYWCLTGGTLTPENISNAKYMRMMFTAKNGISTIQGVVSINGIPYDLTLIPAFEKPSTAQYDFAFGGWSLSPNSEPNPDALKNVEADRTVYVAFNKTIRSYTVNFYNGTTLLETQTIEYGSDATYGGATPVHPTLPDYCEFTGWSPQPTNITGNVDCYAQWYDTREITDDWATIAAACNDGTATDKYAIGAYKMLDIGAAELPYDFYEGGAVVYNGEIHILGNDTSHYKWNGSEWTEVSTLPIKEYYSKNSTVVYNNEIHLIDDGKHYKWNDSEWELVSTFDFKFHYGSVVVLNNEIHALGGYGTAWNHYKWNGSEWTEVSTLPSVFFGSGTRYVLYNNEIHGFGGIEHHKWNGTEWIYVSRIPVSINADYPVVCNNEIHIIMATKHYAWNGSEWRLIRTFDYSVRFNSIVELDGKIYVLGCRDRKRLFIQYSPETEKWSSVGATETINFEVIGHNHDELADGVNKWERVGTSSIGGFSNAVIYDNEVHCFARQSHHKWDGTTWTKVSTLPYNPGDSGIVMVYNNEIHLFGGSEVAYRTNHYKWDATNSEWVSVSTLPFDISRGESIIVNYNNKIYALRSDTHVTYKYELNGSEWFTSSDFNANALNGGTRGFALVINNELHILSRNKNKHYKLVDGEFVEIGTLPYINFDKTIVYNEEIHIFGDFYDTNILIHYAYNGTEWVDCGSIPYGIRTVNGAGGAPVVWNNEIHLIGTGTYNIRGYHYKWSGASWKYLASPNPRYNGSIMCVHGNKIHLLGGWSGATSHQTFDGESWTNNVSTLPVSVSGGTALSYNNELHFIFNTNHYKWDGTEWTQASTLPVDIGSFGDAVVYNGEIHILEPSYGKTQTDPHHYKWDGTEWTAVGTTPMTDRIKLLVYNGEMYYSSYGKLYKFNGSSWTQICEIPTNGHGRNQIVVYNNEIYVFASDKKIHKWDGTEWILVNTTSSTFDDYIVFRKHVYAMLGYSGLYIYENPTATLTFFAKNALRDGRAINPTSRTTTGGWKLSELREYVNDELVEYLPSDLNEVIKTVKKLSDGGYGGVGYETTEDDLWIPSYSEVCGDTKASYSILLGHGEQYPVFTNNASRIRTNIDGSIKIYHLRSSKFDSAGQFGMIIEDGTSRQRVYVWEKGGIAIGFCI